MQSAWPSQNLLPPADKKPLTGIQVMLQKIEPSVAGLDLEVICSRPLWQTFDLMPPVDDLFDLDPILLEAEPPRRFIGLVTGVAFSFNEKRFHGLRAPEDISGWRFASQFAHQALSLI
jgi:hypothetical protein